MEHKRWQQEFPDQLMREPKVSDKKGGEKIVSKQAAQCGQSYHRPRKTAVRSAAAMRQ